MVFLAGNRPHWRAHRAPDLELLVQEQADVSLVTFKGDIFSAQIRGVHLVFAVEGKRRRNIFARTWLHHDGLRCSGIGTSSPSTQIHTLGTGKISIQKPWGASSRVIV